MILRALTLWPEWAWAVCHLGKDVENRPERAARMVLNVVEGEGGWLAIHAGKHVGGRPTLGGLDRAMEAFAQTPARAGWQIEGLSTDGYLHARGTYGPIAAPLHRSAIVAVARVRRGDPASPWANRGLAQIGLYNVHALHTPVLCSGKQGFWTVPPTVAATIYAQVIP